MFRESFMGSPLVEVQNVRVSWPRTGLVALNSVSMTIRSGEHLLVSGGNGAGKSTLLRLLHGEQWPDQDGTGYVGRVLWHTPSGPDESALVRKQHSALVSAAQQELAVRQEWRVTGEELVLGGLTDTLYMQKRPSPADAERALALVSLLGGEALLPERVTTLSQGQLRLLLVARALVRKPQLLLLDEVTDGLDRQARGILLEALGRAAQLSTLVMTTHRSETVPPWVHRTLSLEAGRIVEGGEGGHAPMPDRNSTGPGAAADPGSTGMAGTGRDQCVPAVSPLRSIYGKHVRIVIENATVFIDRVPVLHDINWVLEPGQNWAVLGRNGAGKSTLLRLLAGDEIVAAGGSITFELPRQGGVVKKLEDLRRGVRLVSDRQQATYSYDITGEELVFSGVDNAVGVYREASQAELRQVQDILRALHLEFLAGRNIRSCSTGELRRLLLARALAGEPDLLLLDEPFSGLDAPSREAFMDLLEQVAAQGVQMVMVTHHEKDILPSIHNILEMEGGRIIGIRQRPRRG